MALEGSLVETRVAWVEAIVANKSTRRTTN